MESVRSKQQSTSGQRADVLKEIYRRVVKIHISLATTTDDDRDARRWSVRQLMDLLNYIESLDVPDPSKNDAEHAAPPGAPPT